MLHLTARLASSFSSPFALSPMATHTATFAAGCFWSVELVFQREPGVTSTQVGYTNGHVHKPTYEQVCTDTTGHSEVVQVQYDADVVSYGRLLDVFFNKHDATQTDGQGKDKGQQYRSFIFYHDEEQRTQAEQRKIEEAKRYGKPVDTQIVAAGVFYPAEEYHQKYLEKGGQCAAKGDKTAIRCYG